MSNDSCIVQ